MLKKIIKTHTCTARWDFVDIIKPTFLRNAVTTNRQRRVITSKIKNKIENTAVTLLDVAADSTVPILSGTHSRS